MARFGGALSAMLSSVARSAPSPPLQATRAFENARTPGVLNGPMSLPRRGMHPEPWGTSLPLKNRPPWRDECSEEVPGDSRHKYICPKALESRQLEEG